MHIGILIPARLESTRLPNKLLLDLGNKSILQHCWEKASATGLPTWIATDSEIIAHHCQGFGAQVLRTSSKPINGTERIAEALKQVPSLEGIVNCQADEPFVPTRLLLEIAEQLAQGTPICTVYCKATDDEAEDPSAVKLVRSRDEFLLYLSRQALPFPRQQRRENLWKHLGIYGFQRRELLRFVELEPTPLELAESIELLRLLEHRIPIRLVHTEPFGPSIDTEHDLERARQLYVSNVVQG